MRIGENNFSLENDLQGKIIFLNSVPPGDVTNDGQVLLHFNYFDWFNDHLKNQTDPIIFELLSFVCDQALAVFLKLFKVY